jgi:hypothetical protein
MNLIQGNASGRSWLGALRVLRLINLVVRADVQQQNRLRAFVLNEFEQQNRLRAFVLNEFEDDSQVVAGATGPAVCEFPQL